VSDKPIRPPGPYEILARVDAVGLCFSDLKLLKQFSAHPRKGKILSGLDQQTLSQVRSYRPGDLPTVPGHEAACTIVATGSKVTCCKVGQRVLVQTDYRWLPTDGSNAAFGYNFEGALQQYVSMDQRVITDPATGQSMLIPVDEGLSSSAVALVEPWACVESSYATTHRRRILPEGRLLVWAQRGRKVLGLEQCLDRRARPAEVFCYVEDGVVPPALEGIGQTIRQITSMEAIASQEFDDIVYFGSDAQVIERLGERLAHGGMMNIVLAGRRIGQEVSVGVGRVHYGLTRWVGTMGEDASEGYNAIPDDGQVRTGERVAVLGAAGPMGQMHVIRLLCSGLEGLHLVGTDIDQGRLNALARKAAALARRYRVELELIDISKQGLAGPFDYIAIMVPAGAMVQQAIGLSRPGTRINIFAGIPAQTVCKIDLDTYIQNRCYMFGTSGSTLSDMLIVLDELTSGRVDTNLSVDAVSGMAGAIDGLKAVEDRTLSGKIIVYPSLPDLPLTPLDRLQKELPAVGSMLKDGIWTKAAEQALLGR